MLVLKLKDLVVRSGKEEKSREYSNIKYYNNDMFYIV